MVQETPSSVIYLGPKKNKFVKLFNPRTAYLYFKNYRLNLLNDKKEFQSIKEFFSILDQVKIDKSFYNPRIIHLFYEFGFECLELDEELDEDTPLAIDIIYNEWENFNLLSVGSPKLEELKKKDLYNDYRAAFKKGYEHLIEGNCYQLNLTYPFLFNLKNCSNYEGFLSALWKDPTKRGAYAHSTWIPSLKKLYASNSPECLFQLHRKKEHFKLSTMPIKGSMKIDGDAKEAWRKLRESKKDKGELNMITDLLRNDLSRIEKPISTVRKKYVPLKVPGIIHQYSILDVKLSYKITLLNIIKALFPGGSITGAPKKRVFQILNSLEKNRRGFYCGSTVLLYKDLMASSINIRSATVDFKTQSMEYGAGGAVTLLSNSRDEYDEMNLKKKSFTQLLS